MGTCQSTLSKVQRHSEKWNPIADFLLNYSIEQLMKEWDDQELAQFDRKHKYNQKQEISLKYFLDIFPNLKLYSIESQNRFYALLDYEQTGTVTRKQLIVGMTIIRQINDPQFIAEIIYFIYLTVPGSKSYSKDKKLLLNPEGYKKFIHENKDKIIGKKQMNRSIIETKDSNINIKQAITLQQFQELFKQYNYDLFAQLFLTESREIKQKKLIEQLQNKRILTISQGETVNILDYRWFYKWKSYIEYKYQLTINYQNTSELDHNLKNKNKSLTMIIKKTKQNKNNATSLIMEGEGNSSRIKYIKPNRIKNSVLLGEESGELKQNLREFVHYVIIPVKLWKRLVKVYGGSPVIQRKYPNINTTIQANVVYADEEGKFYYNKITKINSLERSYSVRKILQPPSIISGKKCYFKNASQQRWESIQNLQISLGQLTNNSTLFICIIPKESVNSFLNFYNIQDKNGKQYIEKRIKNYGSIINIRINNALLKGIVINVRHEFIEVAYKNKSGRFVKARFKQNQLKDQNPSIIEAEKKINCLAGLTNFNNNCYMNSTIQCLIRTASLQKYLSSMILFDEEKKQQGSVISTLNKILEQSKTKTVIDMQMFKKSVQKRSKLFEGSNHQDAQQFLIALLEQLSQQANNLQQQQVKAGFRKTLSSKSLEGLKKQQKIARFFAGMNFGTTECVTCHNRNQVVSPFFTYTLNLPEYTQFEIDYFIIPLEKNQGWKILKCAKTIQDKTTIKQFMVQVSEIHNKQISELSFYCFNQGELFQKLENEPSHQAIKYYHSFGFKIAIYEVDPKYPVFLELRSRYELHNVKNFKMVSFPLLIPIKQDMYWKDVQSYIENVFVGKYQQEQYQDQELQQLGNLSGSYPGKNKSAPKKNVKNEGKSFFNSKFDSKLPYRIRILWKDSYKCFLCNKNIPLDHHLNMRLGYSCKGCEIDNKHTLLSLKNIKLSSNFFVIMLDWQRNWMLKQIPLHFHQSLQLSSSNAKKRIDSLQNIFKQNFQKKELLELRCSQCDSQKAIRSEGIKQFPNILLIHLNRFRFRDGQLVRMNNAVSYTQIFVLNQIIYQLFGVVVHEGTCTEGHYYSFVNSQNLWFCCNDQNVRRGQENEHINPFAYILFYKRKDFVPGVASLNL